jgi:hypothetical protein
MEEAHNYSPEGARSLRSRSKRPSPQRFVAIVMECTHAPQRSTIMDARWVLLVDMAVASVVLCKASAWLRAVRSRVGDSL